MPAWAREEFLQSPSLQAEVTRLVQQQLNDGESPGLSPLRLWAELFAHLEPVPAQQWIDLVADESLARDSWLMGYRILRKWHKRADRESARQDRRQGGAWHPQLWRLPEWRQQAEQFLSAAAEVKPLKAHKRGVVSRIQTPQALVVKHFPPHKKVDPRNALGMSKAIGSLHACEALNRRGLRAAVGYAAWSKAGSGSWMLLEDLARFEALQHVVTELHGDARAALLHQLARYARRMHLLGVAYRDFKPSNILVNYQAADSIEIALIDHDRNWFLGSEITPPRARRDLAALHAGLPNEVRASERLRALRVYGGPWREHRCDWGYRGPLWEQQMPPLFAEAVRRNRLWKPIPLLGS